jgi:hypothetical protein
MLVVDEANKNQSACLCLSSNKIILIQYNKLPASSPMQNTNKIPHLNAFSGVLIVLSSHLELLVSSIG